MMTSKQISIRKEIYDKLSAMKREGESFSDIIEHLIKGKGNLQDVIKCYAIARGKHDEEIHDAYKEARRTINQSLEPRMLPTDNSEG